MKKSIPYIIVLSIIIAFVFSACMEPRYYRINHRHSERYERHHHRHGEPGIDVRVHP